MFVSDAALQLVWHLHLLQYQHFSHNYLPRLSTVVPMSFGSINPVAVDLLRSCDCLRGRRRLWPQRPALLLSKPREGCRNTPIHVWKLSMARSFLEVVCTCASLPQDPRGIHIWVKRFLCSSLSSSSTSKGSGSPTWRFFSAFLPICSPCFQVLVTEEWFPVISHTVRRTPSVFLVEYAAKCPTSEKLSYNTLCRLNRDT